MIDREQLARVIHESIGTVEWEGITEEAKEEKRQQADFLLERFEVHAHMPEDRDENMAVRAVLRELHRAQEKHPGHIVLRHQAWGIIDEEWSKCQCNIVANNNVGARKKLVSTAAMCIRTLIDWPLIQHVEYDLTILKRLEEGRGQPTSQPWEPGQQIGE